jgi:hypothetical protein
MKNIYLNGLNSSMPSASWSYSRINFYKGLIPSGFCCNTNLLNL